jgi:histidinol-phosphate phosphatase family protein
VSQAVLFDRDGTLIVDVPYNGDPRRVTLAPTARAAADLLRARSVPFAVVSNQSAVARGLVSAAMVDAVNARVAELLDAPGLRFFVCPHGEWDACACRKPAPGLLTEAAAALGVPVTGCAMIGDVGADVDAALAAGARPVLVPTRETLAAEVASAPAVAATVLDAVRLVLGGGAR